VADDTDLRPLVIGLTAARLRDDPAAVTALFYGGDGPVDHLDVLCAALDVIIEMAGALGLVVGAAEGRPAAKPEEILRQWALMLA